MKLDKRQKEEYKIARSKERIVARNARKAERRALQKKHEAVPKEKIKPKDFYCEELKARRKAKKERLRAIRKKIKESFNTQAIFYPKYNSRINPHIAAQAEFDIMILHIKQSKATAKKQSKEDKAKYKASLVASKTHVKKDNKASLAA